MSTAATSFDLDAACADAIARVSDYINRAAGQHRRAIVRDFGDLHDRRESRARHHLTLVRTTSNTVQQRQATR